MAETQELTPLETAQIVADGIKEKLEMYCDRCEIVGSIRREKKGVGDIEFCVIPRMDKEAKDLFKETTERCFGFLKACSDIGFRKSGSLVDGKQIVYTHRYQHPTKLLNHLYSIQVEIYCANKNNYGYIQMLRTGPAGFGKRIFGRDIKARGYYCKGGYIYRKIDNELMPCPAESDVWKLLGMDPIMPQFRI